MAASYQAESDTSSESMVFIQGGLWKRRYLPGKILQVPFVKIAVEDRAQDLSERFSVEAAVQDPCVGYL